jgi:uroporphyrinogen decarboxylase
MIRFSDLSAVPDVEELLNILWRRRLPKRVHNIELFHDPEVIERIDQRFGLTDDLSKNDKHYVHKRNIAVNQFLGFDVFHIGLESEDHFKLKLNQINDTAFKDTNRGKRQWMEEHKGPIQNWQDYDDYPWPEVKNIDFSQFEWHEKNMPDNMGCYDLTASILERLTWLVGYESLCYMIYDDPDLVDAICEKVGTFYVQYTDALCSFRCCAIVWGSDDMGFRTSTLLSADFLKEKILPWHKRCAKIAHDAKKPYLLHSCGRLDEIMPDLIDDVKIDAKHSFEDTIEDVIEVFNKYHNKISILGGIDVDFLCRAGEAAIRKRVRDTLAACMDKPGYCLGTGNSVANYIPLDNYLAMIDEGHKFSV